MLSNCLISIVLLPVTSQHYPEGVEESLHKARSRVAHANALVSGGVVSGGAVQEEEASESEAGVHREIEHLTRTCIHMILISIQRKQTKMELHRGRERRERMSWNQKSERE